MASGFGEQPGDKIHPPEHHHLRTLHEQKTGAGVEIHGHVTAGYWPRVLSTSWFYERTRPFRLQNTLRVRLFDETGSAGHNVVHWQIDHQGYRNRTIELRQLLDL